MDRILISSINEGEAGIVSELLDKMNISSHIITEEKLENLGLLLLMTDLDRNDIVSREDIFAKLKA
jgi:hypothetical protein